MPAKQVLFDQRTRVLHDFGTNFHNTVLFNPQGRLILLAGFGNLAGKIEIYDRRTLNKVTTIDGSNTSHCEWSPDGRFLLTATLSPRLRVDNGIKIWHCTGPLLFTQMTDELYQTSWRPTPIDAVPPFGQTLPPAPAPHSSTTVVAAAANPAPVKMGAYRPPGARGSAVSSVYKREEEGGPPRNGSPHHHVPGAPPGALSPNGRYSRSPMRNGRRHVPGAPASPSPGPEKNQAQAQVRKRKPQKGKDGETPSNGPSGAATPVGGENRGRPTEINLSGATNLAVPDSVPPTPGDSLDPVAKKVRNLNKKVSEITWL
jgi:translation initiation factor 2A